MKHWKRRRRRRRKRKRKEEQEKTSRWTPCESLSKKRERKEEENKKGGREIWLGKRKRERGHREERNDVLPSSFQLVFFDAPKCVAARGVRRLRVDCPTCLLLLLPPPLRFPSTPPLAHLKKSLCLSRMEFFPSVINIYYITHISPLPPARHLHLHRQLQQHAK